MFGEGLIITAVGMTSVFSFLLLLVVSMTLLASAFRYLGVVDETAPQEEIDEAMIAAIAAVKLKNS